MPDSQSDADKIRNKRLAKLDSNTPKSPPESAQATAQVDGTGDIQKVESNQSSQTTLPAATDAAATGLNGPEASNGTTPQEKLPQTSWQLTEPSSTPVRSVTPQKRERARPDGRSPPKPAESLEDWEHKQISALFRVTLDSSIERDSHGNHLLFLKGTRAELEESAQDLRLNSNVLDQVLLEAASKTGPKISTLDYLLSCWKRVSRQYRVLKRNGEGDPKFEAIKEARRLCLSYCMFAVTMPEMFGSDSATTNPLTPHLLLDPEDDSGIDFDFLTEVVARFPEDDTVKDAMLGAAEDLSRRLALLTMNDDFKPHVSALRNLVQFTPMIQAITESPYFLPASVPAGVLESVTFLGPFFSLSPLQAPVTKNYFSAPSSRDKAFILNSQRSLRMTLQTHQMDLLDIVNKIVKSGKEPRERMLDWFARCCNVNHKRRAMQVNHKQVSSDGFMINVTVCLDQLCEPFMDASFSKVDRIDVNYLRRNPRVDIKEETKLNADQHESDDFYSKTVEGTNNFISEVFFLTLAAHHYGTEAANATMSQMEKDLKRMKKQLEEVELERQKWVNDPLRLREFDKAVTKWKEQIERGMSYRYAMEGVLLDDLVQTRSMQFMRYVIVWLLRLVSDNKTFPRSSITLPLSQDQPQIFKCLPEYFLEDVVGNFKFIMRAMPQLITPTQSDELIALCITFLRSSEYIKNPYLKAGLITILVQGSWPFYGKMRGILGDQLNALPFANKYLLHSLLKFYVEVEATGAHTQFYDKFNIRFEIFQIIKCIWANTIYRDQLSKEAADNVEFFIRFVNLLLNDVTFVLDESLSAFLQIHNLDQELGRSGATMEQNERREKEEALGAAQDKAKSYMQLTNETVAMLKLFTDALADAFTMPEIVQRLADMLDYNLDAMVGPKSSDLKVKNPEEYGFQPKTLLSELIDVYLNLKDKENFVMAVARDGRSYKPANFASATRILTRANLKSKEELHAWTRLSEKIKKAKEVDDKMEEDYGEIPDDFLDPLMYTLMSDPVILPASKVTLDRASIRSHLLSDPTDPFNRAPLKIEDVQPDTELKSKIEAFKADKRRDRLRESNVMDESAG